MHNQAQCSHHNHRMVEPNDEITFSEKWPHCMVSNQGKTQPQYRRSISTSCVSCGTLFSWSSSRSSRSRNSWLRKRQRKSSSVDRCPHLSMWRLCTGKRLLSRFCGGEWRQCWRALKAWLPLCWPATRWSTQQPHGRLSDCLAWTKGGPRPDTGGGLWQSAIKHCCKIQCRRWSSRCCRGCLPETNPRCGRLPRMAVRQWIKGQRLQDWGSRCCSASWGFHTRPKWPELECCLSDSVWSQQKNRQELLSIQIGPTLLSHKPHLHNHLQARLPGRKKSNSWLFLERKKWCCLDTKIMIHVWVKMLIWSNGNIPE